MENQTFYSGMWIANGLRGNGKKLSGQGRAKLTFQKETISGSMNIRFFLAVPKTQPLTEFISNLLRKTIAGILPVSHAKRALVTLVVALAHMAEFAVCPTSPLCEASPNSFFIECIAARDGLPKPRGYGGDDPETDTALPQ